ncbi:filamentous hemagglutinin family protein [Sphingomonas sp. BT-65]|uniref:filamentous haemagglutinin family protein n=1 Tax=Sphingomonas sp. BT-65 TaxID=2989821 RepID=UPI002235F117|nr:filamentous haemagglutinin family protein [Sphingomonas sp. BT-65]MCW4460663.1 filamentous hemagglutinin family protein [Sphingomonas sp. BT-65]
MQPTRTAPIANRPTRLFGTCSLSALALAASFAAPVAHAQQAPFQSMTAMQAGRVKLPDGTMSQWSGADRPVIGSASDGRPLMSIKQNQQKALLDWENFRLQTNEILEFQQQSADWIAVNRVHGTQASFIGGEIRAQGRVFVFNDNGVLMGPDAKVNVRQLVTGTGVKDVDVAGNVTTITQSTGVARLNWSDLSSQAGEVLRIKQAQKEWTLFNRSLKQGTTVLNGDIEAEGQVVLAGPQGLVLNGKVKAHQAVLSALDFRDDAGLVSYARDYNNRLDPTFSNTWNYKGINGSDPMVDLLRPAPSIDDPNDPLRWKMTVGATGSVETGSHGKIMLFGPAVTNRGLLSVKDEGQVILAAGDNIYLVGDGKNVTAYAGAYNPISFMRANLPYMSLGTVNTVARQNFWKQAFGETYAIGATVPNAVQRVEAYLNQIQAKRVADLGFHARNEGIIRAERGGRVDFRGYSLEQMGAIEMTSTALFRGAIEFKTAIYDYREFVNNEVDGPSYGNGDVIFGKGSLTQITPDLEASDKIPLTSGAQSVGTLDILGARLHMQEDSMIYMPSGTMNVLLDATAMAIGSNRGNSANLDNESGVRFLMEKGATIDLSGWKSTVLPMGFHQVTGKLFAAQLADSPLQRDGPLYRREITVDRRYGTDFANWESFDNLNQGTLAQFLLNGGSFNIDVDDDFIMKSGSVIDVSGGKITYQAGFVNTTLIRTLDNRIIDIREASPDELYMGLANEWVQYDVKWGRQKTYYIPFMSSTLGRYEDGYVEGGAGGTIAVLAPDVVLQGTVKGATTIGKYQRANQPKGGQFILNNAGESEGEYVSNNILITAMEQLLPDNFGIEGTLSDVYGDFFGEEYEQGTKRGQNGRRSDNGMLVSQDFFNRSTMGSYYARQDNRSADFNPFPPRDGLAVRVEAGVNLNLQNGASFELEAGDRMEFLGSIRTQGGDVSLSGLSLVMGENSRIETRGAWYNDFERDEPVAIAAVPRIDGGSVSISATNAGQDIFEDVSLILPESMVIDTSGGAWVDREGVLRAGKAGDLSVNASIQPQDTLDLSGLANARAYGLGGNGAYSLSTLAQIVIGDSLSEEQDGAMLIAPEFFERSGFSKISLQAPGVTINDGVQVKASAASLVLKVPGLSGGPSYLDFASGTDIYAVADIGFVPLEQRPAAQRHGMELNLPALLMGEGALLATEARGSIRLGAASDIAGTILAPAGTIDLIGDNHKLRSTAKLLAPGVVLVTDRTIKDGRELLDGEVLAGGSIGISGRDFITIEKGAVLDVSGTSFTFDVPAPADANGVSVRTPTLMASDGGSISISSLLADMNDATLLAHAGGDTARGGALSLSLAAGYQPQGSFTPVSSAVSLFNNLRTRVYLKGGNTRPTTMYGIDLNTIDWARYSSQYATNAIASFPAGFMVKDAAELTAWLNNYVVNAAGNPTALLIGDNIPADAGTAMPALPGLHPAMADIFRSSQARYDLPAPANRLNIMPRFDANRVLASGGFGSLSLNASPGIMFVGSSTLGGRKADGSFVLDRLTINTPRLIGANGADVKLEANIIRLDSASNITGSPQVDGTLHEAALRNVIPAANPNSRITVHAGTLVDVVNASFYGFGDTTISSGGDIRLLGAGNSTSRYSGSIVTPGKLTLKADQIYAATARQFTVSSDQKITILKQDDGGPLNGTPYEAAAELIFRAPEIDQGGTVRSPLGSITFQATGPDGRVRLLPGSITSVNADGHVIPYGWLSNGDTWLDPLVTQGAVELRSLPAKTINVNAAVIDLQFGAVMDVAGSGDLYAREFVPGLGGSTDWLTGYRDADYNWVSAPGEIFAVIPGFEGDIAPVGLGEGTGLAVGSKIYLSGGNGLAAGYYTLLPASYAALPGAYRVTAKHHYQGDYADMPLGEVAYNPDGSTIQAGYRFIAGQAVRDQRNTGFLVMDGKALRMRSEYAEAFASTFFTSEAFLKKALRTNQPIGDIPRIPIDGGSVVLTAGKDLKLNATLKSGAAKGGRGGFADISAPKIAVIDADTDTSNYAGYLLLDSNALNAFGAESLLLGGVRRQGAVNLELSVGATDVVIDNVGSVLAGPELLFAAANTVRLAEGAAVETRGQITGSSGDLRVLPFYPGFTDTRGTPATTDDIIHPIYDQGTVLRLSSSGQVDILRNLTAVDALSALLADPAQLAIVNASRVASGLAPLTPGGNLIIADGAKLSSSRSLAMDTTGDIALSGKASLAAKQIAAAASRVSVGEVPAGTSGLVFAGGSLGALAAAEDIALKSYSTIDFHGTVTLDADNGLTLDAREIRAIGDGGDKVTVSAGTLTIANANGGAVAGSSGDVAMLLAGDNIHFSGGDKRISGVGTLTIDAAKRVIGHDDGALFTNGALTIDAGAVTAESGARLFFDAGGAISLASAGGTLDPFSTFGATIGFTGSSITSSGRIGLTGGIVNLRARQGDVVLASGSSIDVTSNVSRIFDVEVGVGAGTVNLTSDRGNITLAQNAVIDVSGSSAGGDAGALNAFAGLGNVTLGSGVKGSAIDGYRSGSFSVLSATLGDFTALNAALDAGGFRESRRFEFNQGDATITGTIRVRDFAVVANDGSINLAGTIETVGANGGRVQLAAAENVNLLASGKILAKANAADGSGGTVLLETQGRGGGRIDLAAGSLIDVSGTGDGGRLVRLRAPQIGNDMAVGQVAGTITGARQVLAEAFRVYEGVTVIDQPVINMVQADAAAFMNNAQAIQARLGGGVTVAPGIELRSDGDMELKTDWDLHNVRFNGAAGVLTLRAKGDLKINANLSDGFTTPKANGLLLNGPSWTFNLTAGANVLSPNSLAVLPGGLLDQGKGSIIVGGTPDTIEYYYDPARGNENRLYLKDPTTGRFVRTGQPNNYHLGWVELTRNAQGRYLDPQTGQPILKDPVTGDYVDTDNYARRPLPTLAFDDGGGYARLRADGSTLTNTFNLNPLTAREIIQWDNSTGYLVRTGTAGINLASAKDLVLQYRPSVIYTAGENAPTLAGFYAPAGASYPINGGDISVNVAGTIFGSGSPQLPSGWLVALGSVRTDGVFAQANGRAFDQSTWYVNFPTYQAGIGALGGGNIDISAGGDILNLAVNLPTTGRVVGNTKIGEPMALTVTGGGDLNIRAGGNIGSGKFYVAEGLGVISAGGAFISSDKAIGWKPGTSGGGLPGQTTGQIYYYIDPMLKLVANDIYTLLYTSSGEFRVTSGGDMNIEAVLDPLMPSPDDANGFFSYTPDAKVSLFSAGGDIKLWNNGSNIDIERLFGDVLNPTNVGGWTSTRAYAGTSNVAFELWPANVSVVAASGDINVLGGLLLAPSPTGTLDLLARGDVHIGNATRNVDQFIFDPNYANASNFRSGFGGIILSQSYVELHKTPLHPFSTNNNLGRFERQHFLTAGPNIAFTRENPPVLHVGDTQPVRIYAGNDIVTSAAIDLPKAAWIQAGGDVYFPNLTLQHNNALDLSIVRAGAGMYFNGSNYITVNGPGRLEIETGGDLWIPSNANGITSNWLMLPDPVPWDTNPAEVLNPGQKAADIAISVGFNQRPDVAAFETSYLDPNGSVISYLLKDAGGGKELSYYLFDRLYTRGDVRPDSIFFTEELRAGFVNHMRGLQGLPPLETAAQQADYMESAVEYWMGLPNGQATPFDQFFPSKARAADIGVEFYLPEQRQGLVNYVRKLQGLEPLETQAEQLEYLDTAWKYWEGLGEDYKSPFLRDVLYLELRTTGREANDPESERNDTTFRGYDAIKTLFPGAQKRASEALAAGESRWKGDFETYASRVLSNGGGQIDFMIPGGALKLANIAAPADATGQPPSNGGRGNALRAGIVTANGGAINIFAYDDVTVNQSRVLTALGGNMLIWSSYGDIAAGKGAKTSISPTFYNYTLHPDLFTMGRTPAGLPTGAGIGTVASIPGAPVADVDLIAPNGIVDAGDAGIRVSGNFNVFAVQILGTDNIDVAGIAIGLPTPPAAPLNLIQPTEADAQSREAVAMVTEQVRQVRRNSAIGSPSIIEVRVTGFGEACTDPRQCPQDSGGTGASNSVTPRAGPALAAAMDTAVQPVRVADNRYSFDVSEPTVAEAVLAVGRLSRANIVYDPKDLEGVNVRPVRGSMTTEAALRALTRGQNVQVRRIGPNSFLLKGPVRKGGRS